MLDKIDEKFSSFNPVAELNEPTTAIERFAKKVFDKLIEDGVPPIPYYYKIYFLNMLEEESDELKSQVQEYLSLEGEGNEIEKNLEIEKKLKLSFKYSKELLQHTAALYKNSQVVKELFEKYKQETSRVANPKVFERMLVNLEDKVGKLNKKIDKELDYIKEMYSKNIEILKKIESNSIYDTRYNIYNYNFFIKELEKEMKLIKKFKHKSSVVLLKIRNDVFANLSSEKSKILLNRSVSKIMLETSRRMDIIAHFKNGIFSMLLKHTDLTGACKTVERLSDIISKTTIILEGEEIEVKIVAGVGEIKYTENASEYLDRVLGVMEKAEQEKVLYKIYEGN